MPEFPKFDIKYLKAAFWEPYNIVGMAIFVLATYVEGVIPLVVALDR